MSSPPGQAGVNLAGFLTGELGLGEVARKLARALAHAGVPFAAIPYRRTPSRKEHPLDLVTSERPRFDTNIVCLNPDYLNQFTTDVGVDFFAGRYSIGVWFWETNVLRPESLDGMRFLDEIWVASEYVRTAVAPRANIPVHVMMLPIEPPLEPDFGRSDLGLPDAFTFLYLFDFVSAQRKNPVAVVEAFKRAFAPAEGPVLLMKSINGSERKPVWLELLREAAAGRPDIEVRDGYVSASEKDAIVAASDCFVSLHRSEGFGLTLAEAMSYGKPVIATGYSGNLEFMSDENSYLVPYRLVPIPSDWWAYAPGAEWAEPDVDEAARLMKHVYAHQSDARSRGARGRDEILTQLSLELTAEAITARLDEARRRGAVAARSSPHDVRAPILEASQELARGVGESLAEAPGRMPAAMIRRLLMRALWPYLEEQRRLTNSTLNALTGLQRSVDELAERLARLESEDAEPTGLSGLRDRPQGTREPGVEPARD